MDRLLIGVMGRLIYWDGKRANTVFEAHGKRIYGITWDKEHILIAVGRKGGEILVFDGEWRRQGVIQLDHYLQDAHQILWWKGTLYIVESGCETVLCYRDRKVKRVGWMQCFYERPKKPHINSIWCDGKRFYVVEHWRQQLPKKVRILDLKWQSQDVLMIGKEIFGNEPDNGIHNVYIENGWLYTLGPGRLIQLDLSSGETSVHQMEGPWPYYLRGLARTDGAFYVGMSQFARVRSARTKGESAFAVLDDALKVRDMVTLKDTGPMHEIRALVGDRAHNGIECPFRG